MTNKFTEKISLSPLAILGIITLVGSTVFGGMQVVDSASQCVEESISGVKKKVSQVELKARNNEQRITRLEDGQTKINDALQQLSEKVSEAGADIRVVRQIIEERRKRSQ